jgi:hypothetical protein
MKKRYKVKNINKTKLKSYLQAKTNTNETNTRHNPSSSSK